MRPRLITAAGVAALLGAGLFATARALQPSAIEAPLQAMAQACAVAMAQQVCRVEASAPDLRPTEAPPPVFVVGIGAIDGQAYRTLRESGEAMCETARQACNDDRTGAVCVTALQLWGDGSR
jgi:hypothetical protein